MKNIFCVFFLSSVVVVVRTVITSGSVVMKVYVDGTPIYRSRENGIEIFMARIINNDSGDRVWFS